MSGTGIAKGDVIVAPSLLSADFSRLGDEAEDVVEAGADWLHLDIMDGHFVPNITFGPGIVASLRRRVEVPLDVHLMIEEPERFLGEFIDAGADVVTVHFEATVHIHRTLQRIKDLGARAGVAVNPGTPVEVIGDVLDLVDLVLIMSVNPGFGGQTFITRTLGRLERLAELLEASGSTPYVEVDGGINRDTGHKVRRYGAKVLVAGSYIFSSPNRAEAIASLRGR